MHSCGSLHASSVVIISQTNVYQWFSLFADKYHANHVLCIRFTTIFIFHVQIYGKYFNKYYPPPPIINNIYTNIGRKGGFSACFSCFSVCVTWTAEP